MGDLNSMSAWVGSGGMGFTLNDRLDIFFKLVTGELAGSYERREDIDEEFPMASQRIC